MADGKVASFPTVKQFLKKYLLGRWTPEQHLNELQRYAAGEQVVLTSEFSSHVSTYGVVQATSALGELALDRFWHSIQSALSGKEGWDDDWRQAVAYSYWRCRFDYAWHVHALEEFEKGIRRQALSSMFVMNQSFAMGNCLSLGWYDLAVTLTHETYAAIDKHFLVEGAANYANSHVHIFMLQLVGAWQQWPARPADSVLNDTVYADILKVWRSPDAAALTAPLLAACDRHMQQSHVNTRAVTYELWWLHMWYVPFEILSVLRLREALGLENPALDHPLLNTALGKLRSIVPPDTNPVLQAAVRMADKQLPAAGLA